MGLRGVYITRTCFRDGRSILEVFVTSHLVISWSKVDPDWEIELAFIRKEGKKIKQYTLIDHVYENDIILDFNNVMCRRL